MAYPSLLQSTASSFHGLATPLTARLPYGNLRNRYGGVVSVRATGEVVLVEKSEADKPYRLKSTYLEKIVPFLKEEFNYTNIHQSVFPEIRFDALDKPRGMDICITTTAKSDKEGQRLLALMGMPFREGGGGGGAAAAAAQQRKKKLKSHHFDKKGSKGARR